MGIFSAIGKAAQNAQKEAKERAERFKQRVEASDFEGATHEFLREFPRASIMAKNSLSNVYRQRISEETDKEAMYRTFERLYDRRGDMAEMAASQWIGQKLYHDGDDRVEAKEDPNSNRTIYRPCRY